MICIGVIPVIYDKITPNDEKNEQPEISKIISAGLYAGISGAALVCCFFQPIRRYET